jgi:mannose-6-phosphate isomerase-like protein (cupin superfamily)
VTVSPGPFIIQPEASGIPGNVIRGTMLVIGDWPADGSANEVDPLHVHHADDEAWHVVAGALRFRFGDLLFIAEAGATVLVPPVFPTRSGTLDRSHPDSSSSCRRGSTS